MNHRESNFKNKKGNIFIENKETLFQNCFSIICGKYCYSGNLEKTGYFFNKKEKIFFLLLSLQNIGRLTPSYPPPLKWALLRSCSIKLRQYNNISYQDHILRGKKNDRHVTFLHTHTNIYKFREENLFWQISYIELMFICCVCHTQYIEDGFIAKQLTIFSPFSSSKKKKRRKLPPYL